MAVQLFQDIIKNSSSATAALAWTLVDASVNDVHAGAMSGRNPGQILAEASPQAQQQRCDLSAVQEVRRGSSTLSTRSCRRGPSQQKSQQ